MRCCRGAQGLLGEVFVAYLGVIAIWLHLNHCAGRAAPDQAQLALLQLAQHCQLLLSARLQGQALSQYCSVVAPASGQQCKLRTLQMANACWIGSTAAVDQTSRMRAGIAGVWSHAAHCTQGDTDSLWTSTHCHQEGRCKALSGCRTAAHKKMGDLLCKLDVVSALGVQQRDVPQVALDGADILHTGGAALSWLS